MSWSQRALVQFVSMVGAATAASPEFLVLEVKYGPTAANSRRRLTSQVSDLPGYEDIPTFPGTGTHFAEIYVGSPPQKASVILDTGSHLTSFVCASCTTCGHHTDPGYDITKSTSGNKLACGDARCTPTFSDRPSDSHCDDNVCRFGVQYQEGSSWSAFMVRDKVWLGQKERADEFATSFAVDYEFGCQDEMSGKFESQVSNGIMGFADDDNTLVPTMFRLGKIKARMFSMCFTRTHGILVMGGIDFRLHKEPVQWVPLMPFDAAFTFKTFDVELVALSLGTVSLTEVVQRRHSRSIRVVLDSGTTDTYFPADLMDPFMQAFEDQVGKRYDVEAFYCFTPDQFAKLPAIEFALKNGDDAPLPKKKPRVWKMPPWHYTEDHGQGGCRPRARKYQPRVFLNDPSGNPIVLGANAMRGHDVIFDSALIVRATRCRKARLRSMGLMRRRLHWPRVLPRRAVPRRGSRAPSGRRPRSRLKSRATLPGTHRRTPPPTPTRY
jgi:hypothetical protein